MGVIPTRMMPMGVRKKLPYDAEVEYLESTGTQYVDTGLTITSGHVAFSFEAVGSNTNAAFIGQQVATPRLLGFMSSSTNAYVDLGESSTRVTFGSMPDMVLAKSAFSANTNAAYFPIYLFTSRNNSGPRSPCGNVRCRYCQFWDAQGNLVRDFVPVRVGTVGALYDRRGVGGMNPDGTARDDGLYFNRGTGAFTIGPDK